MTDAMLVKWLTELEEKGIRLTERQQKQFLLYFEQLVDWNERVNLTAITDKKEVYYKHFYDSLTLSFFVPMDTNIKIADVGAGAGFPSVPLAIAFPDIKVTIIDSLNKRIRFLEHLCELLGIKNVTAVHARAEEAGHDRHLREQFDLVTARAVARLQVLSEYCLPFVKVGGTFAAMKASDTEQERKDALHGLKLLGGSIKRINYLQIPFEKAEREIIEIRKTKKTPKKFPRKPGTPAKTPL